MGDSLVLDFVSHEVIRQRARELAEADLNDGERVQKLLHQLHVAVARHFAEAELIVTSTWGDARPAAWERQRG
ncbi:MAG: hypothetical protein ACXVRH_11930 [Thermoleophilaceae bacterium]